MKRFTYLSLSVLMAMQPSLVMAENGQGGVAVGVNVVGGVGHGNTGFLSAGDYNINKNETSLTDAINKIITGNQETAKMDREYLQAKGKVIADALRELVEKKQAFANLSVVASTTRDGVSLADFLKQVNDIKATIDRAEIAIQEASIISADTLPSATASVGGVNINTAAGSVINMSGAMNGFVESLNKLRTEIDSTQFKVVSHKGQFSAIMQNALNADLSKFPVMDAEEIKAASEKIQMLQTLPNSVKNQQQALADKTVTLIKKFIERTGTSEFLRLENENDKTFFREAYTQLEQHFFMRSYLRRKYGIQIGAIQPKTYPKTMLHLEQIATKDLLLPVKTALGSVVSQTVRTDADLMQSYDDARNFVEQYDKRVTPILSKDAAAKRDQLKKEQIANEATMKDASLWEKAKSEVGYRYKQAMATFADKNEIMRAKPVIMNDEQKNVAYNSDDTGVMARMSSFFITATGQAQTVEALLAVMRLILADIREEIMINQGDIAQAQSYSAKRFMSTPEQAVRSIQIMCNVDTKLSEAARQRAAAVTNGKVACRPAATGLLAGVNSGGTLLTDFRNIMTSYESYVMKNMQDARSLANLVEMSLNAQSQAGDAVEGTNVLDGVPEIPKQ